MATANFRSMANFDIWAYIYEPDEMFLHAEHPEVFDEDGEIYPDVLANLVWDATTDACDMVRRSMEELNDTLGFHRLSLEGGYYAGMQVFVEEPFWLTHRSNPWAKERAELSLADKLRGAALDLDDYYDEESETDDEIIDRYHREVSRIEDWLENKAWEAGFEPFGVAAAFSNGETVYAPVHAHNAD